MSLPITLLVVSLLVSGALGIDFYKIQSSMVVTNNHKDLADTLEFVGKLQKRSVNIAAIGLAALRKLLAGSREVPVNSVRFRKHEKQGNIKTALEDFYSVRPTNIIKKKRGFEYAKKRHSLGDTLIGQVGDRRLILRQSGDKLSHGRPVLEVVDLRGRMHKDTDRIVYEDILSTD